MDYPINSNQLDLSELVRRAKAGEDVVLTQGGRPAVRLQPIRQSLEKQQLSPEERRRALNEIVLRAQEKLKSRPHFTLKEIDDEMYDEDGLPK